MISVLNPGCLASMMQELKDMGVNTVFLQGPAPQPKLEKLIPFAKECIVAHIQTAHRNGLKVALTIGYKPPYPKLEEIDLEALNSRVIEYAKLAEQYEVELFAPLNEPEVIFLENTGKWRQEILPKIRKVYHGEIVWKGATPGLPDPMLSEKSLKALSEESPGDFLGYDYIGFSTSPTEDMTLEEYDRYVDNALKLVSAWAKRDGCKGVMITEFGAFLWEPNKHSEEDIARAHQIVLERGKDRAVGFFVLEFPPEPGCVNVSIEELELITGKSEEEIMAKVEELKSSVGKTKEVIKRWFTEIL